MKVVASESLSGGHSCLEEQFLSLDKVAIKIHGLYPQRHLSLEGKL